MIVRTVPGDWLGLHNRIHHEEVIWLRLSWIAKWPIGPIMIREEGNINTNRNKEHKIDINRRHTPYITSEAIMISHLGNSYLSYGTEMIRIISGGNVVCLITLPLQFHLLLLPNSNT